MSGGHSQQPGTTAKLLRHCSCSCIAICDRVELANDSGLHTRLRRLTGHNPGLQIVLTTKSIETAGKDQLPVSYDRLPQMVEIGDEIFLGRYLVTGAEEASLFMEVLKCKVCPNPALIV